MTIYHHTSAVIGDEVLRHLSQDKIDSFIACFIEPELSAEYTGELIKITCPYERKGDLYKTLQIELGDFDKSIFYIRNVTPAIHHLIQLYLKTSWGIRKKHVMYLKGEQIELKIVQKWIRDPVMLYEDVREKSKAFHHYQCETMDVCKASESAGDKVREFNDTGEPKFANILVEADNDDKIIKIHYPANEQEGQLEVKNWFNVRLKHIKTTGRGYREFGGYASSQPSLQQAGNKDRQLVINPKRTPLGMKHRSMSTYASSTVRDPDSYKPYKSTSKDEENVYRKDSSDLRPSRHGEMVSEKSGANNIESGNKTYIELSGRRERTEMYHSTSGSNTQPVRSRELEVQNHKSEAVYWSEKNLVIKVYAGPIIHQDVDCIVNAADEDLLHGGGVAGVIASAAGLEFRWESRKYIEDNGSLDVGQCVSTGAGRLKYKFVLHAVGPQWNMYKDKDDCGHDLMKTIYNTLKRAEILKMKSVAIPFISSGIFGVPWDVCAEQYARGIERFEEESSGYLKEVHFVDINEKVLISIRSVFSVIFKVKTSQVEERF